MKLNISDIHSLCGGHAFEVLAQIARVKEKMLPTNEAFGLSENLWRKKCGIGSTLPFVPCAVSVREKGAAALLHNSFARTPARCLYLQPGFKEREEITDYFTPGRTAIRMILDLSRGP
ncbi:hypothetical protein BDV41DRAFT_569515 [Aspergillus transmontanensis]|uniref:Uncharacterized protein n=1 Tax=Aspergillus transmontanensis TaxID=1034304 RepID=A0A5N6VEI5_9EURO|nr:hypothetical protein BDV41DRAFT_569515 [Aspergillus transmontanensis]